MPEHSYGLGRIYTHDPVDQLYPIQLVLDRISTTRRTAPWKRTRVLDQGQTGTCVGHGWRGWYENEPTLHAPDQGRDAFAIYRQAILLDDIKDNDNEENLPDSQLQDGSTVRAGAKAMQQDGAIGSYVWATKAAELADYVTRIDGSPIVVGTNWYNGMFRPNPKTGVVSPTGGIAGGHCWVVNWWDGKYFTGYTSWGQDFGLKDADGIGGEFKLTAATMTKLLRAQGEACCGVELVVTPLTP